MTRSRKKKGTSNVVHASWDQCVGTMLVIPTPTVNPKRLDTLTCHQFVMATEKLSESDDLGQQSQNTTKTTGGVPGGGLMAKMSCREC